LRNVSKVNQEWKSLTKEDELWKIKCKQIIENIPLYSLQTNTKRFKKLYKLRLDLKLNWESSRYNLIEFKTHEHSTKMNRFDFIIL